MKCYITKFALTQGILKGFACDEEQPFGQPIKYGFKGQYRGNFVAGEWFVDYEEAVQNAELRRREAIAELSKKITELTKLKF